MTEEELLKEYAAGIRDFHGVNLPEANLSGAKLSGVNLSQANLSVVNFSGANLIKTNLSHSQLNVARLSGAHLESANLRGASLNVANLIRADLSNAQLQAASLIRAELIRANLSYANLSEANLRNADLREATLRHAIFREANLSEANFRESSLVGTSFERANLNNTDLSRTDLSLANFRDAELKQANLSRANLSGANLSGANLRWADLRGANLSWADLSQAKLSGAHLMGADLSNTNLTNASLVHADLTHAILIKAEWVGADLTGATLTGAKLYHTSRFGLKTDGITCEWVDLSPGGDRSIIQRLNGLEVRDFFNETPPTIQIIVDKPLDHDAHFAIAGAYYQIAQQYKGLRQPPSLEISRRRTVFTFRVDNDTDLFPTAFFAILPFRDAANAQKNLCQVVEMISSEGVIHGSQEDFEYRQQLIAFLGEATDGAAMIKKKKRILAIVARFSFFQAPTQMILTNSSAQSLIVHDHPNFGKTFLDASSTNTLAYNESLKEITQLVMPSFSMVVDFFKGFHYVS